MKPRQFVKAFRDETEKHLRQWHHEAPSDISFEDFIKVAAKKENRSRDAYWKTQLHRINADSMVEFTIDGAQYRILNKPTALAYAYKHASRAV